MDFARYNGTAPKTVRKRSAAELVAAATERAAASMFGIAPAVTVQPEPMPMPVVEPEAEPAPPTMPDVKVVDCAVAIKAAAGMRVRWLNYGAGLHGRTGKLIALDSRPGALWIEVDVTYARVILREPEWLTRCFPLDGSVKPRAGMKVYGVPVPESGAREAVVGSIDERGEILVRMNDTGVAFPFHAHEWLEVVWPMPGECT